MLTVQTDKGQYQVPGTLSGSGQERLPPLVLPRRAFQPAGTGDIGDHGRIRRRAVAINLFGALPGVFPESFGAHASEHLGTNDRRRQGRLFDFIPKSLPGAILLMASSLSADRELTKDCIQELFLEIWNSRPSLDREVKNVRSYLFTWLRRKISRELSRLAKEKVAGDLAGRPSLLQSSYEELLVAFQQSEEKRTAPGRAQKTHQETTRNHQAEILRKPVLPQHRRSDLPHPPNGLQPRL